MYLRPWISKHAWAKFNLGQLVKVQAQELRTPNQWGNHSHISNGTHQLPHIWPFIFTPTSAQNPCFYQKLSPKVLFFSHCPEFWKFFSQRPLIGWNLRKRYPNVPYFYGFCDWKTPYYLPCIHMVCLRGMLLPQTWSEAGKFCILETESCHLVNTFRYKFNGDENEISVLQAQPTQLCIIGGQGWYTGYYHPSQTWKGIYPTTTLYKSAHLAL